MATLKELMDGLMAKAVRVGLKMEDTSDFVEAVREVATRAERPVARQCLNLAVLVSITKRHGDAPNKLAGLALNAVFSPEDGPEADRERELMPRLFPELDWDLS